MQGSHRGLRSVPAPTPRSSKLPRPPDPGDLKPPLPPMYSPIKQIFKSLVLNIQIHMGFYWFVYFCRLLLVSALTVNFHWLPNLRLAVYTVKNLTYQRETLAFFPDFWEGCSLSNLSEGTWLRGEWIDYTRKPGRVSQGKDLGPAVLLEQEAGFSSLVSSTSVNGAV